MCGCIHACIHDKMHIDMYMYVTHMCNCDLLLCIHIYRLHPSIHFSMGSAPGAYVSNVEPCADVVVSTDVSAPIGRPFTYLLLGKFPGLVLALVPDVVVPDAEYINIHIYI